MPQNRLRPCCRFVPCRCRALPVDKLLPPPCEGMLNESAQADFAVGGEGTPSSNHGVLRKLGLVDFLSVVVSERELQYSDEFGGWARAQAVHPDPMRAMIATNDLLPWFFPQGSLRCDTFENKGRLGYKQSADIYYPGGCKPCGFVARGGNGSTILVSVSGAGMPFVGHMGWVKTALDGLNAKITRLDAAFDDLDGEYLDMDEIIHEAKIGVFNRRGQPPRMRFIDDMGTRQGCSLYIGSKGRTELNIYDKGKEQGDEYSVWRRAEARQWANNRVIPTDHLLNPLGAIVGAYPAMAAWLPDCAPAFSATSRRAVQASVSEMTEWLTQAAGKSLGVLREAAMESGITDSELMNLLVRDGLPARFAQVPELVVHKRANEYLQGVICE